MAQENPFKSWDSGLVSAHELHRLEKALTRQSVEDTDTAVKPVKSKASAKTSKKPASSPKSQDVFSPPAIDQGFVENLATLIAQSLGTVIQEQNLFADRFKQEELKLDNEVMAKHIYTLIQKRGIQEQQMEHLQREQKRWKHLFWKLYLRHD